MPLVVTELQVSWLAILATVLLKVLFVILGIAYAFGDNTECSKKKLGPMRLSFLRMHNGYRSHLAQERNASRMKKMKYDCDAEKSAYESAKQCLETASPSDKYDENLHVIDYPEDVSDVALEAGNSWWSEILDAKEANL
ncbi:hypothetical protein Aduo_014517 [Ancylostoma duodenale]